MDRPDLDEFLGALNGFLNKRNNNDLPDEDSSYARFLEIFCRSVGSSEGHLLEQSGNKGLQTLVSCGLSPEFNQKFNQEESLSTREPSPLDIAFRDKQVVAVSEIKPGVGLAPWFLNVMSTHQFKSFIAVPLLGQNRAMGVLCAYYKDVCLIDQGTMDRLMTIGRMVGSAMESSQGGGGGSASGQNLSPIDQFLEQLHARALSEPQVHAALLQVLVKFLSPAGMLSGSLNLTPSGLFLVALAGTGVPPQAIQNSVEVPRFLAESLLLNNKAQSQSSVSGEVWGALRPWVTGQSQSVLSQPIIWDKKPKAAVLVWRSDTKPFNEVEVLAVERLASIASLVLRFL
ncbi:MAG: hypothetical protein KCHDKBKB_01725 [Elusimicrobia bacterium]|nr:hypothetical protein [Elusimicrobiota bacterium]